MSRMANIKLLYYYILFFILLSSAAVLQGSRSQVTISYHRKASGEFQLKGGGREGWVNKNSRRLMIGSVAPTCTYNECRGCKYKCRAEQVPVEVNDPMNSSYLYKCVCHI